MSFVTRRTGILAALVIASIAPIAAQETPEADVVRIATFNASLNRGEAGALIADLADPTAEQPARVAAIIQHIDPDVILINEFDFDEDGEAARLFIDNFLAIGQHGNAPWVPEAHFIAPVNTGVPSGFDFNRDGIADGPDDAYGFGFFPGQYGMLLLSKFPIDAEGARTFQNLRWIDVPDARLPQDPEAEGEGYYSTEALEVFRLSSKSHWDVPVTIGDSVLHVLASHPTPPAFDGPELRNKLRNADEVRFWIDYIAGADYFADDAGTAGPLAADSAFVILGDLNLDPVDGDGFGEVIVELLGSELVVDPQPTSAGGPEAAERDGGANAGHGGDAALDTADFFDGENGPGNLRVDYVLPSRHFEVVDAGVFWPASDDPLAELLGPADAQTSDHRLVWVDIRPAGDS
jgi:hypothetical protein